MKTIKNYLLILGVLLLLVTSCEDKDKYKDSTPPGSPTIVDVKPLYGGATIFYEVPDDEDVLQVQANYTNEGGKTFTYSSSYYVDSLSMYGFPDTSTYNVNVYAMDRAGNKSEPAIVEVKPLEPAILRVLESVEVKPGFGSFFVQWINELEQNVKVYVDFSFTQDGTKKEFTQVFSSNLDTTKRFIENLDLSPEEPIDIDITIEDDYGNSTSKKDMGMITLLDDVKLPTEEFSLPLSPNDSLGGVPMMFGDEVEGRTYYIIDGIIDKERLLNFCHTGGRGRTGNPEDGNVPWNLIIDLGDTYKLSRIRTYQRFFGPWFGQGPAEMYYTGENVGHYAMYIWDAENAEWVKIREHKIPRPEGVSDLELLKEGRSGDLAYMYPENPGYTPKTRWFRYEALHGFQNNYTATGANGLSEVTLYGKKVE